VVSILQVLHPDEWRRLCATINPASQKVMFQSVVGSTAWRGTTPPEEDGERILFPVFSDPPDWVKLAQGLRPKDDWSLTAYLTGNVSSETDGNSQKPLFNQTVLPQGDTPVSASDLPEDDFWRQEREELAQDRDEWRQRARQGAERIKDLELQLLDQKVVTWKLRGQPDGDSGKPTDSSSEGLDSVREISPNSSQGWRYLSERTTEDASDDIPWRLVGEQELDRWYEGRIDEVCSVIRGKGNFISGRSAERGTKISIGPFVWRLLDVDRTRNAALLISEFLVAQLPYHSERVDVTWKTCSLRRILNSDGAFIGQLIPGMRERLLMSAISNDDNATRDNPLRNTPGGGDTRDRIFLLSLSEVSSYSNKSYLRTDEERLARWPPSEEKDSEQESWWWLRSPGVDQDTAAFVNLGGGVNPLGHSVDSDSYYGNEYVRPAAGVRPALWLDLSPRNLLWHNEWHSGMPVSESLNQTA
jgi:hypothetical protein